MGYLGRVALLLGHLICSSIFSPESYIDKHRYILTNVNSPIEMIWITFKAY